jgi:hypothetical protein
MSGGLLAEDSPVAQERRPRSAAPVRVEAVDQCESGPESEVLELGRGDRLKAAAQTAPDEEGAEDRAVRQMHGNAGRPPAPRRDDAADQADVGERRPERSLQRGLGQSPDCGSGDAGQRPATRAQRRQS